MKSQHFGNTAQSVAPEKVQRARETLDIYQSTGRLLKKANVDVILIKQQGGYISQPRWADYFAKNGVVHTHTEFLIKKEELVFLKINRSSQLSFNKKLI